MPGVYIKGMEMPIQCVECPLRTMDQVKIRLCHVCEAANRIIEQPYGGRPEWCPLVDVSAHDALIEGNVTFVKREVLTCAASTGALTTTLLPVTGSVFVFSEGDDCGEALSVTVSGKNITNASGSSGLVTGNKYIVYYQAECTEKMQRLILTSTTFPKDVKIYGGAYIKTEDGELLPYKLHIDEASPHILNKRPNDRVGEDDNG